MVAQSIGGRDTPWSIGSVISTAGSIVSRNFVTFVGVSLIGGLLNLFFSLFVRKVTSVGVLTSGAIVSTLINMIVLILVIVTLTYGTVQALRGKPVSIGECLTKGVRRFPAALGAGLLAYLGIVVGSVLLVVPGLILLTMWSVALSATTVERTGVAASLSRSAELTRGRRWRVFGTIVVVMLISFAVSMLMLAIFGLQMFGSTFYSIVGWIVGGIAQAFNVCVFATLYFFLRREKEGVDIEQIASVFD